jgi:hypothetical protein
VRAGEFLCQLAGDRGQLGTRLGDRRTRCELGEALDRQRRFRGCGSGLATSGVKICASRNGAENAGASTPTIVWGWPSMTSDDPSTLAEPVVSRQ